MALRHRVESLLCAHERASAILPEFDEVHTTILQKAAMSATVVSAWSQDSITHYRLNERIGEGGFGVVYRAEQFVPVERSVAVKVLKAGMDSREIITRFDGERRALARMDHPGIARIFDAGTTEQGRPYFSMEFVHGVAVTRFCDDVRMPIPDRLKLLEQVCLAVHHAHQRGILHRDIKPTNILVTLSDEGPRPKVIDFGIAKALHQPLNNATMLTRQGQLIGTPAYMSPEQLQADGDDLDVRCDVYALGVLLYEVLTGTLPFLPGQIRGESYDELRSNIQSVDPPRPSRRVADLTRMLQPPIGDATDEASAADFVAERRAISPEGLARSLRGELDWIVMKCLEKERTNRYASAHELAAELHRFLQGEAILAAPPSTAYLAKKFVKKHRLAVGVGVALIASLLVGLAGTLINLDRARKGETAARFEADRAWRAEQEQSQLRAAAELARSQETEMRKLAETKSEQAQRAGEFMARMLTSIDIAGAGELIQRQYREQVQSTLSRESLNGSGAWSPPMANETAAQLAAFDRSVGAVRSVDIARNVLDEFVLGPASESVRNQYQDQPIVQASILAAVGDSYRALGMYGPAEKAYRTSLETRERVVGPNHPDVARILLQLAIALRDAGKVDESATLAERAIQIRKSVLGNQHTYLGVAIGELAGTKRMQHKLREAEQLYRQALEILDAHPSEEPDALASLRGNLALVLAERGDYVGAEHLYRASLGDLQRIYGGQHPGIPTTLNNLAKVVSERGDLDAAEELYKEAIKARRDLHGDDHPLVATTLNNYADFVNSKRHDGGAAEALFIEVLERRKRSLGSEHPDTLGSLCNLAGIYQDRRQFDKARTLYERGLAGQRRILGDRSPEVAMTYGNLGTLNADAGQMDQAEACFRQSVAIWRTQGDADHPSLAFQLGNLANCLCRMGRFSESKLTFQEALRIHRTVYGDAHPEVARILCAFSILCNNTGDYYEAESASREAIRILSATSSADGVRNLCLRNLGWALTELAWQVCDFDRAIAIRMACEAEMLLDECLNQQSRWGNPLTLSHTQILRCDANLIVLLSSFDQLSSDTTWQGVQTAFAEAECEMLTGFEMQQRDLTTDPVLCRRNLARISRCLSRLYVCWGDFEPGAAEQNKSQHWLKIAEEYAQ